MQWLLGYWYYYCCMSILLLQKYRVQSTEYEYAKLTFVSFIFNGKTPLVLGLNDPPSYCNTQMGVGKMRILTIKNEHRSIINHRSSPSPQNDHSFVSIILTSYRHADPISIHATAIEKILVRRKHTPLAQ